MNKQGGRLSHEASSTTRFGDDDDDDADMTVNDVNGKMLNYFCSDAKHYSCISISAQSGTIILPLFDCCRHVSLS